MKPRPSFADERDRADAQRALALDGRVQEADHADEVGHEGGGRGR